MRALASASALCWITALGVALRIAFVVLVPFRQVYDNALYFEFAERIGAGQGYTLDGHPTAFWSAGYPLTLGALFSVTGPSVALAIALNIVAAAAMVVLMAKIGERISGDRGVGNLAALLAALFPGLIGVSAVTMTEQLYLVATLAGMWLMLNRVGWVAAALAGACFGYAALVRSNAMLFPIGLFVMMLLVREFRSRGVRELGRLAVIMVMVGGVLTPWVMRNARVMGKATVSTNAGVLLAMGNNPVATGNYMEPEEFAPSLGLPDLPKAYDKMHEVERETILRTAALEWMKAHPVDVLKVWPKKLWVTFRSGQGIVNWIRDGIPQDRRAARAAFEVFRYGTQAYYMLVWGAAVLALGWSLAGALRSRGLGGLGDVEPHAALFLAGVGYTCAMIVGFVGSARYGVPVYPFLCFSAATLAARVSRSGLGGSSA